MMAKKPKQNKPQKKKAPVEEKEGFRGIVRIAGKDVKGETNLQRSLLHVRGISHTVAVAAAKVVQKELSIDPKTRVGDLSEKQVEDIDKILFNLEKYDIPQYVLNRQSDFTSGDNRHIIMNDLIFEVSQDVDREKKLYSWKGYRHTFGQKVRGQRTRNTGRRGMAVGVIRKAIAAAAGAAAAGKPGEKEKK